MNSSCLSLGFLKIREYASCPVFKFLYSTQVADSLVILHHYIVILRDYQTFGFSSLSGRLLASSFSRRSSPKMSDTVSIAPPTTFKKRRGKWEWNEFIGKVKNACHGINRKCLPVTYAPPPPAFLIRSTRRLFLSPNRRSHRSTHHIRVLLWANPKKVHGSMEM